MIRGRLDGITDSDVTARINLREAYAHGRKDERAGRRRHPVLMTLTFVAAAIGLVLLVLAAVNGSFGTAGGVVDQQLNAAADQAGPAVRQAADNASQSLHDAARPAPSNSPS
jgi:hypothetical protein